MDSAATRALVCRGGKVIARAAVEGDNEDLLLKIVEDGGKHAEFGW